MSSWSKGLDQCPASHWLCQQHWDSHPREKRVEISAFADNTWIREDCWFCWWNKKLDFRKSVWNWLFLNVIQLAFGIGPPSLKYRQTVLVKLSFFPQSPELIAGQACLWGKLVNWKVTEFSHRLSEWPNLSCNGTSSWQVSRSIGSFTCLSSLSVPQGTIFVLSLLTSLPHRFAHGRSAIWFSLLHSLGFPQGEVNSRSQPLGVKHLSWSQGRNPLIAW